MRWRIVERVYVWRVYVNTCARMSRIACTEPWVGLKVMISSWSRCRPTPFLCLDCVLGFVQRMLLCACVVAGRWCARAARRLLQIAGLFLSVLSTVLSIVLTDVLSVVLSDVVSVVLTDVLSVVDRAF